MITTTVRFDAYQWTRLRAHVQRLEITKAAFIRDATLTRIATIEHDEQLFHQHYGDGLIRLTRRVDHIETYIRSLGPPRR